MQPAVATTAVGYGYRKGSGCKRSSSSNVAGSSDGGGRIWIQKGSGCKRSSSSNVAGSSDDGDGIWIQKGKQKQKKQFFKLIPSRHTAKTKCRIFETNIPRKGISGPQSLFPHSLVCERIIYSHDGSAFSAGGNMWTDPLKINNVCPYPGDIFTIKKTIGYNFYCISSVT